MADQKGTDSNVAISSDGISWTTIGQLNTASLQIRSRSVTRNNLDTQHDRVLHAKDSTGGSCRGNRDAADAGQELVRTALLAQKNGTQYHIRFREEVATGSEEVFGQVHILDKNTDVNDENYNDFAMSWEWNGAPTIQAQT